MATRGIYDNSHNRNRVRIDARPQNSEATQAGMRNVHRDMRGNVIGGVTAEGQRVGTKANNGNRSWSAPPASKSATPRLDAGVQTPRLDAMAGAPVPGGGTAQPPTPQQTNRRKQQELNRSGAFGSGMQQKQEGRDKNLAGRQQLFEEMKGEDATGRGDEFRERARALGVTDEGWDAGVARAQGREPVAKPRASAAAPPDPATMSPRERAQYNIRTKGVEGAAADYFARNGRTQPANRSVASTPPPARESMPADYSPSRETPNAGRAYRQPPTMTADNLPAPETPRASAMPADYSPSRDTQGIDAAPAAETPPAAQPVAAAPAPANQRATTPPPAPLPVGDAISSDARAVGQAVTNVTKRAGGAVGRASRWKDNLPFEVANAATSAGERVARGASSAMQTGQNMLAGATKGIVDATMAVVPGETGRALRAENIGDRAGGAMMRRAETLRRNTDANISAVAGGARRAVRAWRDPAPVVQDVLARFRTQESPAPRGSRTRRATATR